MKENKTVINRMMPWHFSAMADQKLIQPEAGIVCVKNVCRKPEAFAVGKLHNLESEIQKNNQAMSLNP